MAKLNAGGGAAVVLSLCVVLLAVLAGTASAAAAGGGGKKVDVVVEDTVRTEVEKAIVSNPRVGAALVRLVFHDCWVNGCDGSVLLDRTANGNTTEKAAEKNIGLAGFDVIDAIKAKLGDNVSCADIVVLAGRDAAAILSQGKITYDVATGRKDGVTSSAAAADATLPGSTFDFDQLKNNFAAKNFTQKELVILSGAHSIGVAHLSSFQDRINSSTATPISTTYQTVLAAHAKKQRAVQGTADPAEPNNIRDMGARFQSAAGYDATGVNTTATGVLDNSFYHANRQNMVLFRSDWELRNDSSGRAGVDLSTYSINATKWFLDFGNAMAKLSKLPAEGGSGSLEIRKSCRVTNQN